ncbi:MAG: DUF2071 domain-containing protein [Bryobacterales bacterium]|nr:DUF2071 domain-containing protein [Bryobacterales bacterium]
MEKFLTAEWRSLAMLNYRVDPAILAPLVPAGTELDTWDGAAYVSMVGFLFLRTRLFGVAVPGHEDFEEVNLRFYVRRATPEGWRRGVVFAKEIVPKPAVAWVARTFYNENYVALPMRHWDDERCVEYEWQTTRWNRLAVTPTGDPALPESGSIEEFITEHYWGYAPQPDGATVEYHVEHPRWYVWKVTSGELDCDAATVYGPSFEAALSGPPDSAFLAEGSPVTVYKGSRLEL